MLYILNRFVIFDLSFGYLYINMRMVLSIVYTRDSPYESFDRYWLFFLASYNCFSFDYNLSPSYCSSIDSTACIYSPLISNNLSKFSNLFSINLYSSLSLQTQVNPLTMAQIMLQQFSSIAFCQSTSQPLTPFLLATANKYFSPPSFNNPLTTYCYYSFFNPINEFATHFKAIAEYSFFIFKNEIIKQLPFIQVQVFLFCGRVKFISKRDKQENKLLRNYFSSQFVGRLVQQEAMDQRRTQIPEKWEKRCWDFYELDKREINMSLLAYLLSSMILCLTMKLGMILFAKYSNNCLSSSNISYTLSVTFIKISTNFKPFNPASYSYILLYQSNLLNNPTIASTHELSTIQTTHLQYISNNWSFWGYYSSSSYKIYTTYRERSMFGWVRSLMKEWEMCEEIMTGKCYCWRDYERDQRMVWMDYQLGQKRYGWSGYFIRRLVFCQMFYKSYFDCWVRDYKVIVSYCLCYCCWSGYSEYYQRFILQVVSLYQDYVYQLV